MLSGFPNKIQVVLGPNWTGLTGLPGCLANPPEEDDVIVLTLATGDATADTARWTEDGTNTPSATNRIAFSAFSVGIGGSPPSVTVFSMGGNILQATPSYAAFSYGLYYLGQVGGTFTDDVYMFKALFDGTFSIYVNSAVAGQSWITASYGWNPGVFKSMEEYVEGGEPPEGNSSAFLAFF